MLRLHWHVLPHIFFVDPTPTHFPSGKAAVCQHFGTTSRREKCVKVSSFYFSRKFASVNGRVIKKTKHYCLCAPCFFPRHYTSSFTGRRRCVLLCARCVLASSSVVRSCRDSGRKAPTTFFSFIYFPLFFASQLSFPLYILLRPQLSFPE